MGYYKDYLYEDAITWTTDGANAGTVNYRAGKFYCTNVCGVLLSNEVKANQMIAEALNNVAKGYVSYVGNPKLMNNVMADIVIQIPTQAEEREQLSSFFTNLDHLITLHQYKCLAKHCCFPSKITHPWEQRKVQDVADRFDNLRIPVAANLRVHGTTPYYGANGIQDYVEGFTHDGEFVLVAEDGANDLKNYPVKCVNGRIWVNNHAHILQGKAGIADNSFLAFAISQSDIESLLVGGGRAKLNAETLMSIEFRLPCLQEQYRIGEYLTQLDHLITLHQRKYDKLTKVKKSMLEKMFPKNGATVPEIRFKGFSDAWEQRKAKDLCSISTGKSNTQDRVDDGIYPFYVRSPIVEHSNRYLFDEEAVLTVGDGVGTGKVFHYVNGKYDLHQRVYRMYDFSEEISAKYFYYYFSNHFYDRVMAMTAKTSVDSVRYEMIADMDIALPKLKEQLTISNYFDRLDNLITLHQRELEKLKNIKKACLEKMFV